DLAAGLGLVRIAFEALPRPRRILQDLADHLAGLVDPAFDAEAVLVPHRLLALDVEADDPGRKAGGDPPGQPADGTHLALEIEQRDIAFGRAVELDDPRDVEAVLELQPDIGAQAVAAGETHPVCVLQRAGWRVDEVAAELADILEAGAVPAHDVVPEFARREFFPDHHRPAADEGRAGGDHAAGGVIERQAGVHAGACARIHHP